MLEKKFQKVLNMTQEYARFYNYDYAFDLNIDGDFYKRWLIDGFNDMSKICFISKGSVMDALIAEHLSLLTNLFKELGLDPVVSIKANKELQAYLDYLEIDYEDQNGSRDLIISYLHNDAVLGYTKINKQDLTINSSIDVSVVIDEMENLVEESIDVLVVAHTQEERLKASIIMNDLRLSGVICDAYYQDVDKDVQLENTQHARNLLILDAEELKRGLILVKDNLTGEQKKVAEDEIIEYMLGVI